MMGKRSRTEATESAVMTCEERLSNLVTIFRAFDMILISHFKKNEVSQSWSNLQQSFEIVTSKTISLNEISSILNIYPEAYNVRWILSNGCERSNNNQTYELVLSLTLSEGDNLNMLATQRIEKFL